MKVWVDASKNGNCCIVLEDGTIFHDERAVNNNWPELHVFEWVLELLNPGKHIIYSDCKALVDLLNEEETKRKRRQTLKEYLLNKAKRRKLDCNFQWIRRGLNIAGLLINSNYTRIDPDFYEVLKKYQGSRCLISKIGVLCT